VAERSNRKTAGELVRSLEADLPHRRKVMERRRDLAALRVAMAERDQEAVRWLSKNGVHVSSIEDLGSTRPVDAKAIDGLRRLLAQSEAEPASTSKLAFQELLVRKLAASRIPFPGDELTELFDSTPDEAVRWAIANTIAETKAIVPSRWLTDRMRGASIDGGRGMLVIAVGRRLPTRDAIPLVESMFEHEPGYAAMALGEIGGDEERAFLVERNVDEHAGWEGREIEKAIKKIERRSKGRAKPIAQR
jgi:hypothetical protein